MIEPDTTTDIIPAIDIMNGTAVCGKSGDRKNYRPQASHLSQTGDPLKTVESYIEKYGLTTFYVADLDAITGKGNNEKIIDSIAVKFAVKIILDGGFTSLSGRSFPDGITPVAATETFTAWENTGDLSGTVASIDIKNGRLLSATDHITLDNALTIFRNAGVKTFIHLNIGNIGTSSFSSDSLIAPQYGERWLAGGGVSSNEDLLAISEIGYEGAIVSTALRSGAIVPQVA